MPKIFALVTGASSGMGYEFARQLAALRHNIMVVSNQAERNREVAAELCKQYDIEALPLYADLSAPESANYIFDYCQSNNIEVDILVSNAGILHFGYLDATSCEHIERIVTLHCTVPMMLCRLFGNEMVKRCRGRILIVSSISAWTPYPTMSLYGSTKACLKNFAQSLWYEYRKAGVGVTCVFPGAVDTPLYDLSPKYRKMLHRVGLMMSPKTVARRSIKAMLNRKRTYTPGFITKLAVLFCKLLPAHALLPIMKIPVVRRILARKEQSCD